MDRFDKVFKYIIYFLLVFMPFREIIGIYDNVYLKFIPDILIICMSFWYLIKSRFKIKFKIYDYFYILFILAGLLSSIINNVSLLAIMLHVRSFITMYLLFYMLRNSNYKIDFYKNCLKILMIDLSILTLIGIGEHITGKILFFPYEWFVGIKYASNLTRMYTLLHSPNTFGYFAVMVIALYMYLYKNIKNKNWIFLLVLFFLGILLTQSRSSQIALVIVLCYWVVNLVKSHDRKTIAKLLVIFILAVSLYQGSNFVRGLFLKSDMYKQFTEKNSDVLDNIQNNSQKINNRWDIIDNKDVFFSMREGRLFNIVLGFKIWETEPVLGTGFATYGTAGSSVVVPKLYKKYKLEDDFYSDNQYIAIIVESGLIGTILFLMFLLGLIYEYRSNKYKLMIISLLLLICLFYNVFELAVLMTLFYLILTMNIGNEKSKIEEVNSIQRKYIVFCQEHYNPLGIIRSLGEYGIKPIVIIKKGKYRLASKSKYIGKLYMVDTIEDGYEVLMNEYGNEELKPFIYTSDDTITSFLDLKYDELNGKFIFYNAGEKGRITKYMNKYNINKLAEECGLNIIKTWKLKTKDIPKDIEYPCITKAITPTKDNWKADSIICHDEKELKAALKKINSKEILVQKFIKKKNEFAVNGFSINKGKNVFYAFALNYLSIIDNKFGNYMIIKNFEDKELEKKLDKVFEQIKFEGIGEVEFLVDENDELYFLEVNLRNSTWGYSATVVGMNMPIMWADAMISHKLPKDELIKFKPFKAMAEDTDFYDRVKTKRVSLIKWFYQMLSCKCLYITNLRDMKPVYSKIGNIIKNEMRKLKKNKSKGE